MSRANIGEFLNEYRYGFNGQEKVDEIKGSRNSYDMGARLYDTRIGRTPTIDRFAHLYPNVSSYSFSLNNPILLKDEDRNIVTDANGKPVTTIITRQEDGIYKATFDFVPKTSDYVKKIFMDHGGRAIKAAIQVQTGREQVAKAEASKDNIHIIISPENRIKSVEGGESTLFGGTQPGLPKGEGQEGGWK